MVEHIVVKYLPIIGLVLCGVIILCVIVKRRKYNYREEINQYNRWIVEICRLFDGIENELVDVMVTKTVYDDFRFRIDYVHEQVDKSRIVIEKAFRRKLKKDKEAVFDALDELEDGVCEARVLYSRAIELREEWEKALRFEKAKEEFEDYRTFERVVPGLFNGLTGKAQIKRRFRQLAKVYHPDNGGDRETFEKIQSEYENALKGVSYE